MAARLGHLLTTSVPPANSSCLPCLVGLALIVTHHSHHPEVFSTPAPPSGASTTPTTDVPPIDTTKAQVGKLAPDFTLPTTSGKSLTLSKLRCHPVVIAFFASWCQPCDEEMPVLQQFSRGDAGRLRVIGVSYQDLPEGLLPDALKTANPLGLNRRLDGKLQLGK